MKAQGVSSYHVADIEVDAVNQRVLRHGRALHVADLSCRLLLTLCEAAPEAVRKDEIASRVWEHRAVSDETIAQRVRLLRRVLADAGADISIVSVRGIGYRLAEPVTVSAAAGLTIPTENIAAYNAYLLGRHHVFTQTPAALDQGIALLEQAVALDPDFQAAHCALGWAFSFQGTEYGNRPPREVFDKAKSAALRAISLDARSAQAHSLYADILAWYDWDFVTAEREHRVAVSLDEHTCLGLALLLSALERHDEAIDLLTAQVARFPEDTYLRINLAWRLLDGRRFDEAMALAASSRGHVDALMIEGNAALATHQVSRAVAAFSACLAERPRDPLCLANLARAHYAAGDHAAGEAVEQQLGNLSTERYISSFMLALPRFAVGDPDAGFERLAAAQEERARGLIFLNVSPVFDGVRTDPRYLTLAAAVGLPQPLNPG